MAYPLSALLVIRPGPLREALRALLGTIGRISTVEQVDDMGSVVEMVIRHHPTLVLLDGDLPDDGRWLALRQIRGVSPQTRCLVLMDHCTRGLEARTVDADVVLLKGTPADQLVKTIEDLLPV